jgi:hypothetical protein
MESLLLFRRAFSSPTMCRFILIPALFVPLSRLPLRREVFLIRVMEKEAALLPHGSRNQTARPPVLSPRCVHC